MRNRITVSTVRSTPPIPRSPDMKSKIPSFPKSSMRENVWE